MNERWKKVTKIEKEKRKAENVREIDIKTTRLVEMERDGADTSRTPNVTRRHPAGLRQCLVWC